MNEQIEQTTGKTRPYDFALRNAKSNLDAEKSVDDLAVSMPSDITFYTDLAAVDTIEKLREQILSIVNRLGFSDYFFGVLNKQSTSFITTLPKSIYDEYLTGRHAKKNLLLQHARINTSPIYLSTIVNFASSAPIETDVFDISKALYSTLATFGFDDCYNIPRPSQINNKNAIFVVVNKGIPQEEFHNQIERCKPILHLLCEAIAVIGTSAFPNFFSGNTSSHISITPKPLRLLNTLAKDNITLKDAAAKLCISLDTANKHIAAAKNALGANTQAAAIYRAVKAGIIDDEDDKE